MDDESEGADELPTYVPRGRYKGYVSPDYVLLLVKRLEAWSMRPRGAT